MFLYPVYGTWRQRYTVKKVHTCSSETRLIYKCRVTQRQLFIISQYINTMHLHYDKSYLKAHDSISLDAMINYMLDGIPCLCTCNFTVCLSLFHVLWAGDLTHNKPFVLVLDNRRSRA